MFPFRHKAFLCCSVCRWWWTERRSGSRCWSWRNWSAGAAWTPCLSRWRLTLSIWRASCTHSTTSCTWTAPCRCRTAIISPSWWATGLMSLVHVEVGAKKITLFFFSGRRTTSLQLPGVPALGPVPEGGRGPSLVAGFGSSAPSPPPSRPHQQGAGPPALAHHLLPHPGMTEFYKIPTFFLFLLFFCNAVSLLHADPAESRGTVLVSGRAGPGRGDPGPLPLPLQLCVWMQHRLRLCSSRQIS